MPPLSARRVLIIGPDTGAGPQWQLACAVVLPDPLTGNAAVARSPALRTLLRHREGVVVGDRKLKQPILLALAIQQDPRGTRGDLATVLTVGHASEPAALSPVEALPWHDIVAAPAAAWPTDTPREMALPPFRLVAGRIPVRFGGAVARLLGHAGNTLFGGRRIIGLGTNPDPIPAVLTPDGIEFHLVMPHPAGTLGGPAPGEVALRVLLTGAVSKADARLRIVGGEPSVLAGIDAAFVDAFRALRNAVSPVRFDYDVRPDAPPIAWRPAGGPTAVAQTAPLDFGTATAWSAELPGRLMRTRIHTGTVRGTTIEAVATVAPDAVLLTRDGADTRLGVAAGESTGGSPAHVTVRYARVRGPFRVTALEIGSDHAAGAAALVPVEREAERLGERYRRQGVLSGPARPGDPAPAPFLFIPLEDGVAQIETVAATTPQDRVTREAFVGGLAMSLPEPGGPHVEVTAAAGIAVELVWRGGGTPAAITMVLGRPQGVVHDLLFLAEESPSAEAALPTGLGGPAATAPTVLLLGASASNATLAVTAHIAGTPPAAAGQYRVGLQAPGSERVLWRRAAPLPVVAAADMLRAGASTDRPSATRGLVPLRLEDDPLVLEGEIAASYPPPRATGGQTTPYPHWPWACPRGDAPSWGRAAVVLVSPTAPGLEFTPGDGFDAAHLLFALRYDLPILDELFASTAPPEEPRPPEKPHPPDEQAGPPATVLDLARLKREVWDPRAHALLLARTEDARATAWSGLGAAVAVSALAPPRIVAAQAAFIARWPGGPLARLPLGGYSFAPYGNFYGDGAALGLGGATGQPVDLDAPAGRPWGRQAVEVTGFSVAPYADAGRLPRGVPRDELRFDGRGIGMGTELHDWPGFGLRYRVAVSGRAETSREIRLATTMGALRLVLDGGASARLVFRDLALLQNGADWVFDGVANVVEGALGPTSRGFRAAEAAEALHEWRLFDPSEAGTWELDLGVTSFRPLRLLRVAVGTDAISVVVLGSEQLRRQAQRPPGSRFHDDRPYSIGSLVALTFAGSIEQLVQTEEMRLRLPGDAETLAGLVPTDAPVEVLLQRDDGEPVHLFLTSRTTADAALTLFGRPVELAGGTLALNGDDGFVLDFRAVQPASAGSTLTLIAVRIAWRRGTDRAVVTTSVRIDLALGAGPALLLRAVLPAGLPGVPALRVSLYGADITAAVAEASVAAFDHRRAAFTVSMQSAGATDLEPIRGLAVAGAQAWLKATCTLGEAMRDFGLAGWRLTAVASAGLAGSGLTLATEQGWPGVPDRPLDLSLLPTATARSAVQWPIGGVEVRPGALGGSVDLTTRADPDTLVHEVRPRVLPHAVAVRRERNTEVGLELAAPVELLVRCDHLVHGGRSRLVWSSLERLTLTNVALINAAWEAEDGFAFAPRYSDDRYRGANVPPNDQWRPGLIRLRRAASGFEDTTLVRALAGKAVPSPRLLAIGAAQHAVLEPITDGPDRPTPMRALIFSLPWLVTLDAFTTVNAPPPDVPALQHFGPNARQWRAAWADAKPTTAEMRDPTIIRDPPERAAELRCALNRAGRPSLFPSAEAGADWTDVVVVEQGLVEPRGDAVPPAGEWPFFLRALIGLRAVMRAVMDVSRTGQSVVTLAAGLEAGTDRRSGAAPGRRTALVAYSTGALGTDTDLPALPEKNMPAMALDLVILGAGIKAARRLDVPMPRQAADGDAALLANLAAGIGLPRLRAMAEAAMPTPLAAALRLRTDEDEARTLALEMVELRASDADWGLPGAVPRLLSAVSPSAALGWPETDVPDDGGATDAAVLPTGTRTPRPGSERPVVAPEAGIAGYSTGYALPARALAAAAAGSQRATYLTLGIRTLFQRTRDDRVDEPLDGTLPYAPAAIDLAIAHPRVRTPAPAGRDRALREVVRGRQDVLDLIGGIVPPRTARTVVAERAGAMQQVVDAIVTDAVAGEQALVDEARPERGRSAAFGPLLMRQLRAPRSPVLPSISDPALARRTNVSPYDRGNARAKPFITLPGAGSVLRTATHRFTFAIPLPDVAPFSTGKGLAVQVTAASGAAPDLPPTHLLQVLAPLLFDSAGSPSFRARLRIGGATTSFTTVSLVVADARLVLQLAALSDSTVVAAALADPDPDLDAALSIVMAPPTENAAVPALGPPLPLPPDLPANDTTLPRAVDVLDFALRMPARPGRAARSPKMRTVAFADPAYDRTLTSTVAAAEHDFGGELLSLVLDRTEYDAGASINVVVAARWPETRKFKAIATPGTVELSFAVQPFAPASPAEERPLGFRGTAPGAWLTVVPGVVYRVPLRDLVDQATGAAPRAGDRVVVRAKVVAGAVTLLELAVTVLVSARPVLAPSDATYSLVDLLFDRRTAHDPRLDSVAHVALHATSPRPQRIEYPDLIGGLESGSVRRAGLFLWSENSLVPPGWSRSSTLVKVDRSGGQQIPTDDDDFDAPLP